MTLQSQLDQVLAPCPGCGRDSTRVIGGPGTAGGPKFWVGCDFCRWRTWGDTEADAIATWNSRAAVGGEAVAWMLRRKRDDFVRGCYATKPTDESLEFAELDGDYYTPLYASPPATVDVGALRNLIDEMQALADRNTALGMPVFSSAYVISKLAALIGKEA